MTQKEFIKQVEKEANERLKKRFEDRGVLTWEDVSEERNWALGKLGLNNRIVIDWDYPCSDNSLTEAYRLSLAHNRLKKKMEKLQKAYDEMEEAFEAYKKEVLK